jgi:MoxR-like ATPase
MGDQHNFSGSSMINVKNSGVRVAKLSSSAASASTQSLESNQTKTSQNDAFEPLYQLQKRQLKEATVKPGTFALRRTAILLAKESGSALQKVGGTALAAGAVTYFASKMAPSGSSFAQGGIAQAVVSGLTTAATHLVKNSVSILTSQSTLNDMGSLEETYKALKARTRPEVLQQFPADIRLAVANIDDEIESFITSSKKNNQESQKGPAWLEGRIRHRQLVLLSAPLESININLTASSVEEKEVDDKLNTLLDSYPENNRGSVETLVQRMRAASVDENPSRVQAYLYGPAGTGKTRFAKELASILGLPLVEVKFPTKGLGTILGAKWAVQAYGDNPLGDDHIVGELPLKLIQSGCKNPIVLIDEVNITAENLNDIKLLLDPNKKTIKIGGYDAELDWSRATVLIGSNDRLEDEALQTRLPQIVFDKVADEVKEAVVLNKMEKGFKFYSHLPKPCYQRLVSTCKNMADYLVAKDTENFPGVRFIEVAATNVVHFVAVGINRSKPKSIEDIKEYINTQYAQAKGKPDSEAEVLESPEKTFRTVSQKA